jgi:hypothetical protein
MRAKVLVLAGIALWIITLTLTTEATSDDRRDDRGRGNEDPRIELGFAIAPVPLHFQHKNREFVGLGSYLVNAVGDCNGCHSGPSGEFAPGGDPFQGQPKVINQAAYLQGGTPLFGPFFIPAT